MAFNDLAGQEQGVELLPRPLELGRLALIGALALFLTTGAPHSLA